MNESRRAAYRELARIVKPGTDRESAARAFVDAAWPLLNPTGVSWIGFYSITPGRDAMVLGARRDKPACSPIGLHGACGRCWSACEPLVVRDVADLGAGYIACDPRDRSEVVVPCLEGSGECWGVLDLDSHEIGAFGDDDARELVALLRAAGLSAASSRFALGDDGRHRGVGR